MPTRLIRVFLALAIAFVFTGRMEAAAAHCAHLTQTEMAEAQAAPAAGMPMMDHCQEMAKASAPAHRSHHQTPMSEHCDCLAVLQACVTFDAGTTASARIEPYEWARPEAIAFTSTEPSPDFRPPRA